MALMTARITTVKTLASFDFAFQPSLDRNPRPGAGRLGLHRPARGRPPARSTRHGQEPPRCGLGRGGDQGRARGLLCDAGRHHRFPGQGGARGYVARAHPLPRGLRPPDRRRDRLSAGGTGWGQPVLPTCQRALRAGRDDPDLEPRLCGMGRGVRRSVVATALLDRLLHHAVVVQIEGASYRLRQHADLVPEHVRSKATITPPPAPKRRGRPPMRHEPDPNAA